jgi:hypothetical protein
VFHHRATQTYVVRVAGIGTTIPVVNTLIRGLVLVRPFLARNLGHGGDAQRQLTNSWFEDALGAHEWHAPAIDLESPL